MTNKFGQPLPELLSDFAEAQKWTRNEKNETGESGSDAESFIINIVIKLVQKLSLLGNLLATQLSQTKKKELA